MIGDEVRYECERGIGEEGKHSLEMDGVTHVDELEHGDQL